MTRPDELLDISKLHFRQSLKLHRVTKTRWAQLTGIGAAKAPGRWNRFRQEAIYASLALATTELEKLVHTPKIMIPSDLSLLKITLSGDWVSSESGLSLRDPKTRAAVEILPTLRQADAFFEALADRSSFRTYPFALAVPSVVTAEWNVVLYPQEVGFEEHVKLETIEPFEFDPRLFPEGTPIGPAT